MWTNAKTSIGFRAESTSANRVAHISYIRWALDGGVGFPGSAAHHFVLRCSPGYGLLTNTA